MFWQHEFLTWTPEKCGSVEKISLPVEDIWTPDIIVYEFIDEDKSQRTPFVYVNHTGRVRYDRMLRVVSSCNLGIFNFPFDVQNCSLTFGSYMHTVRDVRLGLALPVEQILQNSLQYLETSGEWELLRIEGGPDILKFGIDEWDIITFWVVVRRRPILYVVNLLIPSAFLMLIDILSFFLPPHSTDRASFKMTLLLGYTVFLLIMNDLLPSTANGTPLIEQKKFAPPVLDLLPPEALCPGTERQLAVISQNLSMVREMLEGRNDLRAQEEEWIQVGYILDSLMYRLYLIFIGSYAIIIISVWCVWYNI
ncbi:5-hydroxytryptamine receptor 3A-like isoform X2 [Dendropsophus ebraccatus]|uniref:5-hydroxytryptamine receptor 3A-like isoform X2 n=1 Tax=Dendropsophus ebraccatus TaxID=150705 RepID=UPI003831B3B9